jgi:hypothetical protein
MPPSAADCKQTFVGLAIALKRTFMRLELSVYAISTGGLGVMARAVRTSSQIAELTKMSARVLLSEEQVVAAAVERDTILSKYKKQINEFIVSIAGKANLVDLNPAVIEAGIRYIAIAGRNPAVVAEWNAIAELGGADVVSTNTKEAVSRLPVRRARTPGPGQVIVVVDVKKREGEECVPDLRNSNVKWSGRHNHYRGIVDSDKVDGLRARFPNRVTVERVGETNGVLNDQMMNSVTVADAHPPTTTGPASDSASGNDEAPVAGQRDAYLAAEDFEGQPNKAASDELRYSVDLENAAEPSTMPHDVKDDQLTRSKPYGGSPFSRLRAKP